MPTPYKYLKENNEVFYPVTSVNSLAETIPISKGGTGATTAEAARQALGCSSSSNIHFGSEVSLTLTPPSPITVTMNQLHGQVSSDGKYIRIYGNFAIPNNTNNGWKELTVTGLTGFTAPSSQIVVNTCGIRQSSYNGNYDTIDMQTYNEPSIIITTAGVIKIKVIVNYGTTRTEYWKIFPFIIPLA